MSGSQKEIRDDVQDVRVVGGTSGLLDWVQSQLTRVEVERGRLQIRLCELNEEVGRLREIEEALVVMEKGHTALIVERN